MKAFAVLAMLFYAVMAICKILFQKTNIIFLDYMDWAANFLASTFVLCYTILGYKKRKRTQDEDNEDSKNVETR